MTGYYRAGEWVSAVVGGQHECSEGVEEAVTAATKRVETKQSTARHEMKELLTRYPYLKQDRPDHLLLPLAGLFAKEVLG
jgi:hypothetical protein